MIRREKSEIYSKEKEDGNHKDCKRVHMKLKSIFNIH